MGVSAIGTVGSGKVSLWESGHHHDAMATRTLGFWLYMLSDAMIFAGLFAAYGVLGHHYNAAGGPTAKDIVRPLYAYGETLAVFTSVLAYGGTMVALKHGNRAGVLSGLGVALLLGAVFIGMEVNEFARLMSHGIVPQRSGYLSAFFALVITHGIHMVFGLLWMLTMLFQVGFHGFTDKVVYRLLNLKIFWQFQALIWVFVFTFVYMRGAL